VTGFVLFRGLDITKPGPVRWAERSFPGGVGVMADDVVAGLLGAALLAAGLATLGGAG
jgi:phosphatidylglycerophosphatase A